MLDRGRTRSDALTGTAPVDSLSPARVLASPMQDAPGDLGRDQQGHDIQDRFVAADLDRGRVAADAHFISAPVNTLPPAMIGSTPRLNTPGADLTADQRPYDAHVLTVGGDLNGDHSSPDDQNGRVAVSEGNGYEPGDALSRSADPSDALLLILADALDDLERTRIANENRLRSLRQVKGLENSKAEAKLEILTEALASMEHSATLELKRALRQHRFGPWVKRTVGLGEKQAARLIAAVGDPAWNHAEARPRRGPAELWAYCGYAPGQKRRKGVQSNWNADAKMRAYLCAESCMKQRRSPYREVYDRARANWAEKETSDGHKHAHALRCVAKAILKDLWREASTIAMASPVRSPPPPVPQGEAA